MAKLPHEKSDAEWQAEGDVNTLAAADEILSDDKRLRAAEKAAKNMAKEQADRLASILKVAVKLGAAEGMKNYQ